MAIGYTSNHVPIHTEREENDVCEDVWYGFPINIRYNSYQYRHTIGINEIINPVKRVDAQVNARNPGMIFAECGWLSTDTNYFALCVNIIIYFIILFLVDFIATINRNKLIYFLNILFFIVLYGVGLMNMPPPPSNF